MNIDITDICNEWHERCTLQAEYHTKASRSYYKKKRYLILPPIIIVFCVSSIQFVFSANTTIAQIWWLQLIVGILNSSAAVFVTISNSLDYSGLSQRYKNSGQQYESLADTINIYRIRSQEKRKPPDEFFEEILTTFQRYKKEAPIIPEDMVEEDHRDAIHGVPRMPAFEEDVPVKKRKHRGGEEKE